MLEAAPALERLSNNGSQQPPLGAAALRSVSMAMRNGALQNLEEVALRRCTLGDGDIRDFADALEHSDCAKRLRQLTFISCEVGVEGVRVLADLLSRGVFPALECLKLPGNPNITDLGVVALAEALMNSTQTFMTILDLENVGRGRHLRRSLSGRPRPLGAPEDVEYF